MEAFINAIFEKDRVTVEALVQDPQIDVNAKLGSYGKTVLHYACQYGWTRVVELLLARPDIQVNIQDENLTTPLMSTCEYDMSNGDITKLLLEYPGINANLRQVGGYTALHLAIDSEKDEQQEYLLNYPGIDVNVQTNRLETPLHFACTLQKEGLVQKLLSFPEINVNLQDFRGRTPLMTSYSYIGKNSIIAELILKHPTINVNLQDNEGSTALMLLKSDNAALLSNLLSRPEILIDLVDNENQTALFYGIYDLNLYKVQLLIAKGANVNIRNSDGETPLIVACMKGTSDITPYVEAILSRPIDDINLVGISFNALHTASMGNNPVILQLLLSQKGILVNFLSNRGRTPLILACEYGRIENVRILLNFPGIDVNHKDFDGKSALGYALEYALEYEESEIIRMLIFHGAKYYLKDVIQYYPEFKEISTLAKLYKGEIYKEGMLTRYKRQRVENQQSNTQIATTMDIYAVQVLDGLLRSLRLQIPSRIDTSHNFQEVLRYIKTYYYDPIRDEEGNLVYENGEVTFRLI